MTLHDNQYLESNLEWLKEFAPELAKFICLDEKQILSLKINTNNNDYDIFLEDELFLDSALKNLDQAFLYQYFTRTDGISMPRIACPSSEKIDIDPATILSEMVDVHREVFLDYLPHLSSSSETNLLTSCALYKDLVLFGSLMLVPLLSNIEADTINSCASITLVENDPYQLLSALSLFELPKLVDICRQKNIKFLIHADISKDHLRDRIYSQIGTENITLLYGWQTLRSPVLSPDLMELHSWLHAPEGGEQHSVSMLGFATDEINQTQQALWNALSNEPIKVLEPNVLSSITPVVLIASGPSLLDHLSWLNKYQKYLNIVASGSSLGTLLENNIRPSAVVLLERSAEVYGNLSDLLTDGHELSGITAILSSTIDPRVTALFDNSVYFHRPLAAATCLFPNDQKAILPISGPQVVNAALEALLSLGSRELLLIGVDFAAAHKENPRAYGATGSDLRILNIPVRGNQARTVFSDSGLLYSAEMFNRVISATPGCSAQRLGEGAVLSAVKSVELTDELTTRFTSSPCLLKKALLELPNSTFNRDECLQFLTDVEEDLQHWAETLNFAVINANGWSSDLVHTLLPHFQRNLNNQTRARKLLVRVLCHPLFFSIMPLHDTPHGDISAFRLASTQFDRSIQLMVNVVKTWTKVMRPWLLSKNLPLWDPEWLRSRFQRLANQGN